MKKLNLIVVYDEKEENILMCKRAKDPFKGKFNLVGGKVEQGEDELVAAYRELEEETGITKQQISLKSLMNLQYVLDDFELEVYMGTLKEKVALVEEVNHLEWHKKEENFFDASLFAGGGNLGCIIGEAEKCRRKGE